FVHLTLVPFLGHAGELKTKPTQQSVSELRAIGIQPRLLVCRSAGGVSRDIREKIRLFANLPVEAVISARDVDSIYKVPLYFRAEGLDDQILDHFRMEAGPADLSDWEALVKRADAAAETVRIGMVGKYVQLSDAYLSVSEALGHAGIHNDARVEIRWVDAEGLDREDAERELEFYGEPVIYERHRHRYEVNNHLRKRLEQAGLVCSGTSPDDRLVELIELPEHPFFVASQFHPEFKSRPLRPQPLFREFVHAALTRARARREAPAAAPIEEPVAEESRARRFSA